VKRLLKQTGPGLYEGWLYGSQVAVERGFGGYRIRIYEETEKQWVQTAFVYRTVKEAFEYLQYIWGNEQVMTCNILNPAAGKFPIARSLKGGCCDPGTETYHCM
jgi:hypothetical protein